MKRILPIILISLSILLLIFFSWLLLFRDKNVPAGEAVSNLLPFGSGDGLNFPGKGEDREGMSEEKMFDDNGTPQTALFKISEGAVAGKVAFTRGGLSVVRYVDRATGHINEVILPGGSTTTSLIKRKITNTTQPKIYKAHFKEDGGAVLYQSLRSDSDVQENTLFTIIPPSATSSTSGTALSTVSASIVRGVLSDVTAGTGNNLFYVAKDADSIIGSTFNTNSPRTILSLSFNEWDLKAAGSNLIITSKAASGVEGFSYLLNTSSGALTKILGPLVGLSAAPNASGSRIIYSYNDGAAKTTTLNIATGATTTIYPSTLADKCVWSERAPQIVICGAPSGPITSQEPDNWYKGATRFSDRIWRFDTNDEVAEVLAEPQSIFGIDIDAMELELSPLEDYVIFINKRDLSLWALRI